MKKEKIFITGGSGFMGTNLMMFFLQKEYTVCNYDIKKPQYHIHERFWIDGDILDLENYTDAINKFQPDYFVHLAARTDLLENQDLINGYAENIKGVENTIEIIRNTPSIKRILFASSRMVCDISHIPNSDDDYSPPNFYGLSKVIGEKLIRGSNLEKDKEWVIFRPTSIWGEWFDSPYIIFFQTIKRGFFFKIQGHNPKKSFGYVGNSVYQIDKLMTAPKLMVNTKTFYLCDYPPLVLNNWAELINKTFEKKRLLTLPQVLLKPMAYIGDILLKLGWNRVPLTNFRLRNLTSNMVYPTDELSKICGELPFDSPQGVENTINWMKNNKNRDKLAGKKLN